MSSYRFPCSGGRKTDDADVPEVDSEMYSSPSATYYHNYRVEKDGVLISPTINCFLHTFDIYFITAWESIYENNFVIVNDFLFVSVDYWTPTTSLKHQDFFVLSGPEVGTITHNALLSEEHSVELKPTEETCGPALQVELTDGRKRWLFPHPDGQRAAWEHLKSTTDEDDSLKILEIGKNIIEHHKSL